MLQLPQPEILQSVTMRDCRSVAALFYACGQQRTATLLPLDTMQPPPTETVAARLESATRAIAPTVALLIALAIHCYHAGRFCGRMIHTLNDRLAARWPSRPITPVPAPADPLVSLILAMRADGISQRAIAAELGMSRASVRRRLAMV
jgi:hypothetical protein